MGTDDSLNSEGVEHPRGITIAGMFTGIGGIELGLRRAGHRLVLLCEIDPSAQVVLRREFLTRDSAIAFASDVLQVEALPSVDLLAAGFPCQDLSQAGRTAGIQGRQSGLVGKVLDLIRCAERPPTWLLLENVPFMLHLDRGRAMSFLTSSLDDLGYRWAYRVIDTRAFGLPHRRKRVLLLASKTEDPRAVLFVGNEEQAPVPDWRSVACGFYWTEGLRGLGWAVDAVPTLKGGSTIGIPSPPAILKSDGGIVTPSIEDAERLQGFPRGWTIQTEESGRGRTSSRWKLVSNAVSVPVAKWVGERLLDPMPYDDAGDPALDGHFRWPLAAWGWRGTVRRATLSTWPVSRPRVHLLDFLDVFPDDNRPPLSERATRGFLKRLNSPHCTLNTQKLEPFTRRVEAHLRRMSSEAGSRFAAAVEKSQD